MSETKFTKGQWMFVGGNSFEKDVVITNDYRVDSRIVPICEMGVYFDGVIGVEQSANAHLIACAPEMYAMLEKLSSQLTDINAHAAVNEIEALLAKARGDK